MTGLTTWLASVPWGLYLLAIGASLALAVAEVVSAFEPDPVRALRTGGSILLLLLNVAMAVLLLALVIVMMLVARSWQSVAPEVIQITDTDGPDVNVQFSDHGEDQVGDALRRGDLPGLQEMQQATDARTRQVADALAETNQ